MSSKRKSHPMKILSDTQLYPSNKAISPHPSNFFSHFPISPNFLPPNEIEEAEETVEIKPDLTQSAENSEMTNAKSHNEVTVASHREAMNQILKKLALKSQENMKKSKEENSR
jgi:hypothetical protein